MILGPDDFTRSLNTLRPLIGNYGWMLRLLSARARATGGWFPRRLHQIVRRFGNPRRPYFIGTTGDGLKFLGDYRDTYSVICEVCPGYDDDVIDFVEGQMRRTEGAYLDVGTNLGLVASAVARRLQGSHEVLAFEPMPDTARRAAATFALNGVTNLRLFQAAVGDEDGDITFYDAPGHSEAASANPTQQRWEIAWRETKVPCRRLDTLAQEGHIGAVGLMKLDVEGHESKAVRGAQALIRRDRPTVIYEYHPDIARSMGFGPGDVAALVQQTGAFRVTVLGAGPDSFPPSPESMEVVNICCEPLDARHESPVMAAVGERTDGRKP
jgi:FkbM family methyltransferase